MIKVGSGRKTITWIPYLRNRKALTLTLLIVYPNLRILKLLYYLFPSLLFLGGCAQKPAPAVKGAFTHSAPEEVQTNYDFDQILNSGEIIVATLSGPDTYFDYQGQYMGLQYALVAHFAQQNGLRVRVELAHDVPGLVKMLELKEADVICYQLPDSVISASRLVAAGANGDASHTSWAVRSDVPLLAEALNGWYGKGIEVSVEAIEKNRMEIRRQVRRKVRAPYLSREKGIISIYDAEFKSAARVVGWDWRLMAAQCYQESGFDPSAESWAGAKGLMQIMPGTAQHLNLSAQDIYTPHHNISAAARYLKELNGKFSDIRNSEERIKFILASYNGGAGHVRDAMALARKHGRNATSWNEVSPFILKLSEPAYYRDPVVKYGYMIGSETYNYVISIFDRWRAYGGKVAQLGRPVNTSEGVRNEPVHRRNRFSKDRKIYTPDDPEFKELAQ